MPATEPHPDPTVHRPHNPVPPRLALVGDRSRNVRAHQRIPAILSSLSSTADAPLDTYWLHSSTIDATTDLTGFDGIWVVPGSPYENVDGVIHAIATARTNAIPFLGTCGGFQHMLLELARNVCGLEAAHAETDPAADQLLLVPMACSLLGEEDDVTIEAHTLAARIMGAGPRTERYFCSFGLNADFLPALESGGLVVGGRDAHGAVRLGEIADHPFYLGTLFQPELSSTSTWVHPVLRAFAAAVRDRAAARVRSSTC
jgi:CTP synthase (UTP-ammonia lyase)